MKATYILLYLHNAFCALFNLNICSIISQYLACRIVEAYLDFYKPKLHSWIVDVFKCLKSTTTAVNRNQIMLAIKLKKAEINKNYQAKL